MYFTSGQNRAFERLMQEKPGFDHYDDGGADAPEDCGTCRFYRPDWKYQFCVYAECPYQPGKLTAQVLQAALKKYLQHWAKGKNTLHHGQQSLKQLKKHGVALSNIEITEANIGAFKPCAKKYGVDFTLRKDKTTQPPHCVVIFKSKDADNLEQAFREFTAKTLSKEQRPSIRKVLSAVKQKVAAQTKQRAKEKIEERGLEL